MFKYTEYNKDTGIVNIRAGKITSHIILGILGLFIIFGSFTIIKVGEVGVILRTGSLNRIVEDGIHLKFPIIELVDRVTVRTVKIEVPASAASNDLQIVTSQIAVQYNVIAEEVATLYRELGKGYRSKVIDPAIQDAMKEATSKFSAEELITKRDDVSNEFENILKERLLEENIFVSNVDIVNFDFSASFNAAIEAKVTAEQKAFEAENKLAQVEFEAAQRVATAEAEAEAIRIQANAINSQGGRDFVQLKAIEKWNGVLPTQFVPGSAVPFLNLIK